MIFLKLFLVFLEIGAVSFGGGYGMISLLREQVLGQGWLEEAELLDIIAVAESTPGPIAVNMATFIGAKQGGLPGALCATTGVVLPSFLIILLIAALIRGFLKYKGVQAFLQGVRPCVVGLILATAGTLLLSGGFGMKTLADPFRPDFAALGILAALAVIPLVSDRLFHKKPSPIVMILISAALGMAVYAIIDP